jgi:hypothetical protein
VWCVGSSVDRSRPSSPRSWSACGSNRGVGSHRCWTSSNGKWIRLRSARPAASAGAKPVAVQVLARSRPSPSETPRLAQPGDSLSKTTASRIMLAVSLAAPTAPFVLAATNKLCRAPSRPSFARPIPVGADRTSGVDRIFARQPGSSGK